MLHWNADLDVQFSYDGVSGVGESFRQLLGQERFVLYHQNPQCSSMNGT